MGEMDCHKKKSRNATPQGASDWRLEGENLLLKQLLGYTEAVRCNVGARVRHSRNPRADNTKRLLFFIILGWWGCSTILSSFRIVNLQVLDSGGCLDQFTTKLFSTFFMFFGWELFQLRPTVGSWLCEVDLLHGHECLGFPGLLSQEKVFLSFFCVFSFFKGFFWGIYIYYRCFVLMFLHFPQKILKPASYSKTRTTSTLLTWMKSGCRFPGFSKLFFFFFAKVQHPKGSICVTNSHGVASWTITFCRSVWAMMFYPCSGSFFSQMKVVTLFQYTWTHWTWSYSRHCFVHGFPSSQLSSQLVKLVGNTIG